MPVIISFWADEAAVYALPGVSFTLWYGRAVGTGVMTRIVDERPAADALGWLAPPVMRRRASAAKPVIAQAGVSTHGDYQTGQLTGSLLLAAIGGAASAGTEALKAFDAATADSPALTIDDAQFGAKVRETCPGLGLDPSDPAARQSMRDLINNIFDNPEEVRQGPWNPKGGGGVDYLFYRQGPDVVVTNPNNEFVAVLQNGIGNGWFREAGLVG